MKELIYLTRTLNIPRSPLSFCVARAQQDIYDQEKQREAVKYMSPNETGIFKSKR